MVLRQLGRCPGCRRQLRHPHIDHNHYTGAVRGLLCNPCNLALGHAKDMTLTLTRLASYLKRQPMPLSAP